jgi:hypothetical protein
MDRGSSNRAPFNDPAEPPGFEQYTVVLMKRGDHWNPNAPEFMDVMKQHRAFINQMTDQGNLAIAGPFEPSHAGSGGGDTHAGQAARSGNWRMPSNDSERLVLPLLAGGKMMVPFDGCRPS